MTLKASKSRKTPTLQQNTFKGLGSQTCRIGPVNRQNIKVAQQKWHRTFLCAEHFYFHRQHLFSCVNPLLLCYRVLNMGRVAICFDIFWSFLRLWSKIWQGAQPPYKMKFWQCCDFIIPYKILWDWFVSKLCPNYKFQKFDFFFSFKNVEKLTRQPPASCLTTTHIVTSLWRHAMEDNINI